MAYEFTCNLRPPDISDGSRTSHNVFTRVDFSELSLDALPSFILSALAALSGPRCFVGVTTFMKVGGGEISVSQLSSNGGDKLVGPSGREVHTKGLIGTRCGMAPSSGSAWRA